jgi:hypothetical protein
MALIKCPDCGNDVSTAALACPHCGRPVSLESSARPRTPPPIPGEKPGSTPPPVPTFVATPSPPSPAIPPPPPPAEHGSRPSTRLAIFWLFVVIALGLLGAALDFWAGSTILAELDKIGSDWNDFVRENPFAAFLLELIYPDLESNAVELVGLFRTAASFMILCGFAGGIATLLFLTRRLVKPIAAALIFLGIAPMFHHHGEFFGLPMTLAGIFALIFGRRWQR